MTQSLAQLQAELRHKPKAGSTDLWGYGKRQAEAELADALQPHVEREAADLELIRRLLNRVYYAPHAKGIGAESHLISWLDKGMGAEGECETCDLIDMARARLEENSHEVR